MKTKALIFSLLASSLVPLRAQQQFHATTPWPAPVRGFDRPSGGEHPRLFFRKADLPEIRRRATQTEEGKAIVARLRELLGNNGERLPDQWNNEHPRNNRAKGPEKLPIGAFTFTHPAGYGMLYQLTGDKKYAALAREGLERMFKPDVYSISVDKIKKERGKFWRPRKDWKDSDLSQITIAYGQPDRDERYTWTMPGAPLRVGPMMASVALAYDLCYDAWPEDFSRRVASEILDYNHAPVNFDSSSYDPTKPIDIGDLVKPRYSPTSNHFGAYLGGAGTALLALRGDPGGGSKIEGLLGEVEKQTKRLLTEGFGNRGFFAEGHGPSQMASNTAFVPFLQAARVSWGRDFISPSPAAQWITLRCAMEIIPGSDKAYYPNFYPSSYGRDYLTGDGFSDGGAFSQGFGALANDEQRAALLWTYQNARERSVPTDKFDAWIYPQRAVMALINWPVGLKPKNPGEVMEKAQVDELMGHYMFRKEWQDADDLYFTFFLNPNGKKGHIPNPRGGNFRFFGYGIRSLWSQPPVPPMPRKQTHFEAFADGGGALSFQAGKKGTTSLAVDYSGKSGAAGVVVIANPWFTEQDRTKAKWNSLTGETKGRARLTVKNIEGGKIPFFVMVMQKNGDTPEIKAAGDTLQVGSQRYRFDGGKIDYPR